MPGKTINNDLAIVYSTLIDKGELVRKQLLRVGLTDYRIKKLEEAGHITKKKPGVYALTDSKGLVEYGLRLLEAGDETRYRICLKLGQGMDSCDDKDRFDSFLKSCLARHYEEALAFLLDIDSNRRSPLNNDANFYLFLLSYVIDIPSFQCDRVKNMSKEDVRIANDPKKYGDITIVKTIRSLAMRRDFGGAINKSKELRAHEGNLTTQSLVTERLLKEARYARKVMNETIVELIKKGQLQELLKLLEKEERVHITSDKYVALKSLARDVINMEATGVSLEKFSTTSDDVLDLIMAQNYQKALAHYYLIGKTKKLSEIEQAIVILLERATVLSKKNATSAIQAETSKEMTADEQLPQSDLLVDILTSLMNGSKSRALTLLDAYLIKNELTAYGYLVRALIEISYTEKDTTYMIPMVAISELKLGKFEMHISEYIDAFNYFLIRNDLPKARIYLELIKDIAANGHSDIAEDDLANTLTELSARLANKMSIQANKKFANTKRNPNGTN